MEATPWISAATGLFGVVTGVVGTIFVIGKRYGSIKQQLETACDEIKEVKQKVEDLRQDYEEHKLTIADSVRETGKELSEKMSELTAKLGECSVDIKHAVTQQQHQELVKAVGRIEGILNGKRKEDGYGNGS